MRIDFTFFSLGKLFNIFDVMPVDDFLRVERVCGLDLVDMVLSSLFGFRV